MLVASTTVFAGNPDRAGSAGGYQLLVNPFARGSALANSATASIVGSEAIFQNVAGLAFIGKTDITLTATNYLAGSGVSMFGLGFGQRVGESSVIGFTIGSFSMDPLDVTTTNLRDVGGQTFDVRATNIAVSYAKAFSNSIYGGITFKMLSEGNASVTGSGFALDAGIRYVTGEQKQMRLGLALKNVGAPYTYGGDGLSRTVEITDENGQKEEISVLQRSDKFELPALLNIGAAYDFIFSEDLLLTINGNFTSNAFSKDQFMFGGELDIKKMIYVRGGYMFAQAGEEGEEFGNNAWTGLSAGLGLAIPLSESGSTLSVDYSYRDTNPFNGIHSIGVRLGLE